MAHSLGQQLSPAEQSASLSQSDLGNVVKAQKLGRGSDGSIGQLPERKTESLQNRLKNDNLNNERIK